MDGVRGTAFPNKRERGNSESTASKPNGKWWAANAGKRPGNADKPDKSKQIHIPDNQWRPWRRG